MASGRLIDYLGVGLASARPAAPDTYTGALGLYFETDTGLLAVWDGSSWTYAQDPGAVQGPHVSVDNTVPRYVGTAGNQVEGTNVTIGDDDELHGFKALVEEETGASYVLVESDTGKIKKLTNATTITLTLPANMPMGFACTIEQGGAGAVNFSPESGSTLNNRQGHTNSAGQWAIATIFVDENAGGAAQWVLGGDTA